MVNSGGVLDVVSFDFGVVALERGDEVLVFVEENGVTVDVEGVPEEGFVGETKDKETARPGRAVVESGSNEGEFGG